ncbi:Nramp family divalent metal transporter [Cupriavidus sp. AU9028]|uniref:Nramp family divalent metal transporter n=1 Tax=Cupriavidus sp. AU9028 TaxID=2871157 RepID=UPI001C94E373|nr:Nramp family divalent metal transporter [Cupriavidus sp. AU9028]MBY4899146.1 Nramp family divalent metal transporter [Cupriavidus sp. AU9028]
MLRGHATCLEHDLPPPPELSQTAAAAPAHDEPSLGRRPPGAGRVRWRRLLAFLGPGYLVAVGYMDPGNWATDLAAGSGYGYSLLWIVLVSSLIAMLLQTLAVRLGVITGMDLAQACRRNSGRKSAFAQWVLCELAICATDLAEVIGTAIALNLLFGIPLSWGVALTVLDVLLILALQQRGYRQLEAVVIALLAVVFLCFAINLVLVQPQWSEVVRGFIPQRRLVVDVDMLYIAIGIIGATVMPHNLYLHSSMVGPQRLASASEDKATRLRYYTADIMIALVLAFFINAAILITAGAAFHTEGLQEVADLREAYQLLGPLTGTALASVLFGVALLASGQSSAVTATLAGQIVMEGFVRLRLPPWARRLLTRGVAVIPAMFVALAYGESGIGKLLVLSQVILSLQLPFAVVPLIWLTSRRSVMGDYVNGRLVTVLACIAVTLIIGMNMTLVALVLGAG